MLLKGVLIYECEFIGIKRALIENKMKLSATGSTVILEL